jgi:hypothetical protein
VKRTGTQIIAPCLLQRYILGNQIDDINPVSDLLDTVLGNITLQDPIPFSKVSPLI